MEKNKISIEFHSIARDLIRNIWVVVLSVLIGYMGIFIASHKVYTPEYTAKATLVVNTRGATTGSTSTLTITNEMANVFVNIFSEPAMKARAAEHLGVNRFDGKVFASVMDQTNFIELKVTADQPQKAYDLLSAIVAVHPEISQRIFDNAAISVIRKPSMPTGPSNAISTGNKELIISACATLSLTAILVLSLMRDTVKNEEAFNSKIDSKLIGSIVHEDKQMTLRDYRQKKKKGLLLHSNAFISLRFAESFHKIAAKLEYMKYQNGNKVFAITSVTENEGKSTCAANVAVALADRGNRVVLVDLDGKKPALFKIFSEQYDERYEIANLFNHKISEKEFRLKNYKNTSLFLALNTQAYPDYNKWIENGEIDKLLNVLKSKADYIIIDSAPLSLDASVTDLIQKADKTILVVRTDIVRTPAINDAIATINTISNNLAGCILNDVHLNIMLFSFTGNDESNYYGKKYGGYGKYGNYGKYGHYASPTPYGKYEVNSSHYGHFDLNSPSNYGYYDKHEKVTQTEKNSDS